ncbi:chromodomain helicase Dna binding protein CHD1/SWI2/SNF2 [Cardiosporidium cionae]|uniref:Chromodomain helicase Dna binding protein CHD1/SWI2/SNF2 n=1 Tax=Cardiosporidium cionae TaxID=476202 RepID=A0ABQ7JAD5_9APIC|nr:chromodomain helicase Dna binding protein CHD1/SWI2/SNF2 [Cardiosporidium cionae]|eukprot:KAF8820970.1 chromodomain helicase Dna binding protein CHD1/SWI2/SNF2 [Cardiosporidium cionae]
MPVFYLFSHSCYDFCLIYYNLLFNRYIFSYSVWMCRFRAFCEFYVDRTALCPSGSQAQKIHVFFPKSTVLPEQSANSWTHPLDSSSVDSRQCVNPYLNAFPPSDATIEQANSISSAASAFSKSTQPVSHPLATASLPIGQQPISAPIGYSAFPRVSSPNFHLGNGDTVGSSPFPCLASSPSLSMYGTSHLGSNGVPTASMEYPVSTKMESVLQPSPDSPTPPSLVAFEGTERQALELLKRKSADMLANSTAVDSSFQQQTRYHPSELCYYSGLTKNHAYGMENKGQKHSVDSHPHFDSRMASLTAPSTAAWNVRSRSISKKVKSSLVDEVGAYSDNSSNSSSSGPASSFSEDESEGGESDSGVPLVSSKQNVFNEEKASFGMHSATPSDPKAFQSMASPFNENAPLSSAGRPRRARKGVLRYGMKLEEGPTANTLSNAAEALSNNLPRNRETRRSKRTLQDVSYGRPLEASYSYDHPAYLGDGMDAGSEESQIMDAYDKVDGLTTHYAESDAYDSSIDPWDSHRLGSGSVRKSYRRRPRDAYHVGRVGRVARRSTSLRERKKVNYADLGADYETDEEDRVIKEQRDTQQAEQEHINGVDRILMHRIHEDVQEMEYLIKWRGQAHLHNTWEVYETLQRVHGIKKVDNYIRKLQESVKRRSQMTADEIEQEDITFELQRQIDDDALSADRIVEVGPDPSTGVETFLVKWKSSPYDQCTWEIRETIEKHGFKNLIDAYFEREDRIQGKAAMDSIWNAQSLSRTKFEPYISTPWFISRNTTLLLRDYQLTGLNWMVSRMKYGLSVLLADEMGLGKTIQTISLIGHMLYTEHLVGPYLIIVPQSTIDNWMREFEFWLPQANAVCFHGNAVGRDILRYYELRQVNVREKGKRWRFDVCITAPSILNSPSDLEFLRRVCWQLMVVDEAHQLKNRNSKRFQELRLFQSEYKLLLSGTPLHNNLEELWSLLHFMNPLKYTYYEDFRRRYPDIENTAAIGEAKQTQLASLQGELHEVILRRIKRDVEKSLPNKVESILQVEMSPYQEMWYENVYTRNYEQLARSSGGARNSLQNICMELKKVCNHPFFGKMCLLEKLLIRLKEKNHRVLIFSQMVRMLNILSNYLTMKGYKHQRLDGSMGKEVRKKAMDHFNDPHSDDFAFLLSTKAGGLGINLTSADTVIIYDSDWNPQNDLQAEARAHRIGQTKTVQIYRLVTKNSIEQSILERAKTKMVLDTLVVQGLNKKHPGNTELLLSGGPQSTSFTREELSKILKFGASNLWKRHESSKTSLDHSVDVDVDLDKVLSEAQISTTETQDMADDLLSSFNNITEFRYEPPPQEDTNDKDFWAATIPLEERVKFKKAKEQELVVSGPRKTRAKDGFAVRNEDVDYAESDTEPNEDSRKRKNFKHRKRCNGVSDKDRYRLYRSLLKFGNPSTRLEDIHEDSRLFKFDSKVIDHECNYVIDLCRKRLQEIGYKHGNVDNEEEGNTETPLASSQVNEDASKVDDSSCKSGTTSRHFVGIGENKANAVDLVERVELLLMLDKFVKEQNPMCPDPWKLPVGLLPGPSKFPPPPSGEHGFLKLTLPENVLKKLKDWTAKDVRDWGPEQDINLIKGTYIYGFGAWTEVHNDPNLHLEQVKEIKYDKVKMRALRTLKLLEAATTEGRAKQKKGRQKGKETSGVACTESASPEDAGMKSPLDSSGSIEVSASKGLEIPPYLPSSSEVLHVKRQRSDIEENDGLAKINATSTKRHKASIIDLSAATKEELSTRARKVLKPVKKTLKSLKQISNDEKCTDHEVVSLMKRSLPRVGDKICEALDLCANEISREKLDTACWEYVSKYTVASGEDLKRVYLQLCDLSIASKDSFQNPSPHVKWEGQRCSPAIVNSNGTSPLADSPLANSPLTTSPLAASSLANSPLAASPMATSPLTTPLAASLMAASPMATSPLTTSPLAASPMAPSPNVVNSHIFTKAAQAVVASAENHVQLVSSAPAAIAKTSLLSLAAGDIPALHPYESSVPTDSSES